MSRLVLTLLLLLLAAVPAACDRDRSAEEPQAEAELARLADQARADGLALAEAQRKFFFPTAEEAAFLEAGPAFNPGGAPNGYFLNQDGVAGYFLDYEKPFNFMWTGPTREIAAFDGRRYRVMDGEGTLLIKYMGDPLLLQRYEGAIREGFWQGYGRYRGRGDGGAEASCIFYQGEFRHDLRQGRGVTENYNLSGDLDRPPYRYTGEMAGDLFHGQGTAVNLATGRLIYRGLWFEGRRFEGPRERWLEADAAREYNSLDRQMENVLYTDRLRLDGFVNSSRGPGPLVIFPPEGASEITVSDEKGRSYPLELRRRPADGEEWPAETATAVVDLPPESYPQTLDLTYRREDRLHYFSFTARRPFTLVLEAVVPPSGPASAQEPEPAGL